MAYIKPPYLIGLTIDDHDLSYNWDDTRPRKDFQHDGDWLPNSMQGVHLNARIAVGIGIYEWVVWRFYPFLDNPEPLQLAAAAWCATVHPDYMFEAGFDRFDWRGPIRGPLWAAQTWLVPMARCDDNSLVECESGLSFLYSLAMHVLPTTTAFESWLSGCIERTNDLYAVPEEDQFKDLFRDPLGGRGPLVAPALLDLSTHYDPSQSIHYMSQFLIESQRSANPFLITAEEMTEEGFETTPYDIRNLD